MENIWHYVITFLHHYKNWPRPIGGGRWRGLSSCYQQECCWGLLLLLLILVFTNKGGGGIGAPPPQLLFKVLGGPWAPGLMSKDWVLGYRSWDYRIWREGGIACWLARHHLQTDPISVAQHNCTCSACVLYQQTLVILTIS